MAISPYLDTKYTADKTTRTLPLGAAEDYTPRFYTSTDLRFWVGEWSQFLMGTFAPGTVRVG
jgi:hypothetical protein